MAEGKKDFNADMGSPVCEHGVEHYCGLCEAKRAPKCKHGNPYFCGLCWTEEKHQKEVHQPRGGNLGFR